MAQNTVISDIRLKGKGDIFALLTQLIFSIILKKKRVQHM